MRADDGKDLESLATRAAAGDERAFGELVEQTQKTTYPLALRLVRARADAEDVLQESYVRVWRGLPALRDRGATLGWICKIVRNVAVDRIRHQRRRRTASLDQPVAEGMDALVELIASDAPDPEHAVTSARARDELRRLVDELKEKHRIVLLLREVDDMSYEEISAALGIPVGTVESRLHRARKALADKVLRAANARDKERT